MISTVKLFADDISLFSIVVDAKTSACKLNKDFRKMSFIPDLNKQAQEVIFSRKTDKSSHPLIYFNSAPVSGINFQKHLAVYLERK